MGEGRDHYRVLGVLEDAEDIVVRAAYKALAQRYHPDKWSGNADEANRRMADLNAAYAVLSDPSKRRHYDAGRLKHEYRPSEEANESRPDDASDPMEKDWAIAVQFQPDLQDLADSLGRVSIELKFTYKLVLLESKNFAKRVRVADELEAAFLKRYFGNDQMMLDFAKQLILAGNRLAAKELNDAVRVLGSGVDPYAIVQKIAKKYDIKHWSNYSGNEEKKQGPVFGPTEWGIISAVAGTVVGLILVTLVLDKF